MIFKFNWLEISTGKTGTGSKVFANRLDFYKEMNLWNQASDYKYWEAV